MKNNRGANTALAKLPIGGNVGQEIRNAVQAGKEVTIHEKPVSAFGWTGYGYSIVDPETGAGGYIIEGGGNGAIMERLQGWLDTILGWMGSFLDWVKNSPGYTMILSLPLSCMGPVGIAFSIVLSIIALYFDVMTILDAPCGGGGMVTLFLLLTLVLGIFSMKGGGLGVAIMLSVAAYLLPFLFNGLMDGLKGVKQLCPE
jgi:hypothetical protein